MPPAAPLPLTSRPPVPSSAGSPRDVALKDAPLAPCAVPPPAAVAAAAAPKVAPSYRGLAIQLRDAGSVTNVTMANVTVHTELFNPRWWGAGEPIYLTALPRSILGRPGRLSNVLLLNVSGDAEAGIMIAGQVARSWPCCCWLHSIPLMMHSYNLVSAAPNHACNQLH